MIINGGSYRAINWWADHLQSKENDRAGVVTSYGLRAEDIREMLFEMEAHAQGTRCENFFYQMNLNPAQGERLTEEQWGRAREIAERKLGLEGQPYFVVEHVKHGRPHQHIVWSRIDLEAGRGHGEDAEVSIRADGNSFPPATNSPAQNANSPQPALDADHAESAAWPCRHQIRAAWPRSPPAEPGAAAPRQTRNVRQERVLFVLPAHRPVVSFFRSLPRRMKP